MAVDLARTEKRCSKCSTVRPLSEFNRDARRPDGFYPYCRACRKAGRTSKADHYRNYEMTKRYGIGLDEYNELLAKQGGVCAICKEGCIQKPSLAIDHDHETGRVRALLCGRCNQGIGLFREDLDLLAAAAAYLAFHQEATDG